MSKSRFMSPLKHSHEPKFLLSDEGKMTIGLKINIKYKSFLYLKFGICSYVAFFRLLEFPKMCLMILNWNYRTVMDLLKLFIFCHAYTKSD